jgi:hypothetical protein
MATLTQTGSHASADHIQRFEHKIGAARKALATLPGDDFYDQMIVIIHRAGWTTIAEGIFFEAALDAIVAHTKQLAQAHQQILSAADAVGRQ